MSTIQKFNNVKDYQKALRKDLKAYKKRLSKAVKQTVSQSVAIIKKNAPTGKGNNANAKTKSNIKANVKEMKVVCERPYSAYIEDGLAPCRIDVKPLLDWCEEKNIPEKIAYMIMNSVKTKGIKPTFFMSKSLPEIEKLLSKNIKAAMSGNSEPIGEK